MNRRTPAARRLRGPRCGRGSSSSRSRPALWT